MNITNGMKMPARGKWLQTEKTRMKTKTTEQDTNIKIKHLNCYFWLYAFKKLNRNTHIISPLTLKPNHRARNCASCLTTPILTTVCDARTTIPSQPHENAF